MSYLPEFIKYRVNCGFALGIMLITPLATLVLNLLTFDMQLNESYNFFVVVLDILFAIAGFMIVIFTHHYLTEKELQYAKLYS